jgi:predicted permease
VEPEGYVERAGEDMEIDFDGVSPGYLEMLGMPVLRGRSFAAADREGAAPVAVVNEAFAARFWPGEDPVGKRIRLREDGPGVEVVGLVRNGKLRALNEAPRPAFWVPVGQASPDRLTLHVHTRGDPAALVDEVRAAVRAVDPEVATTGALPFAQAIAGQLLVLRTASALFAAFGVLALAIATIGLYGVIAYAVSRRVREIGIRIALGARAGRIVRGVVWEGVSLASAGVAIGLAATVLAASAIDGFLFGVEPTDPAGFVGIALLLLAVAALASWLPARRATRVDPVKALRAE